jgi:hypothetical protein
MSFIEYREKIAPLSPVAVKVSQSVCHAPEHAQWGVVTCEASGCGEKFVIGPHKFYGTKSSAQMCVKRLEQILVEDHAKKRIHANSYELPD